jgi:hypothetical protein
LAASVRVRTGRRSRTGFSTSRSTAGVKNAGVVRTSSAVKKSSTLEVPCVLNFMHCEEAVIAGENREPGVQPAH